MTREGSHLRGIIDQIEEEWVIVEINGETRDFKRAVFPKEAKVGDIVDIQDNKVKILKDETEQRRKEIEDLMDELWED